MNRTLNNEAEGPSCKVRWHILQPSPYTQSPLIVHGKQVMIDPLVTTATIMVL